MNKRKDLKSNILVCIPSYNSEEFIGLTLENLINQEYKDFEVIVVDNASEDRTFEVVEEFKEKAKNKGVKINTAQNEKNIGRTQNWNKCLDIFLESDCKYLKFIFAGDTLYPDGLKTLAEGFKEHSDVGTVVGGYIIRHINRDEDHKLLGKTRVLEPLESLRLFVERGNWVGAPIACLFKKDAIAALRFAENLEWAADWKLYVDIANFYNTFYIHKDVGVFYVKHRKHFLEQARTSWSRHEELSIKQYVLSLIEDRDEKLAAFLERYLLMDESKIFLKKLTITRIIYLAQEFLKILWRRIWKLVAFKS